MNSFRRIAITITLVLCAPAALLLAVAEAAGSRVFALSLIVLTAGLMHLFTLAVLREWKRLTWPKFLPIACAATGIGIAVYLSPTGNTGLGNFQQTFHGDTAFRRVSITNCVAEVDQLKMGCSLIPFIDPFINLRKGREVTATFLGVYREMREDPAFVEAGSALGLCYEDLFLNSRRTQHHYAYVPRQHGKTTYPVYPVLIFLHGSLGNFKGYTWVLKAFADKYGVAVLCPTFGAGMWPYDAESSVVSRMIEVCEQSPELDEDRMVLSGLSNGGMGLAQAIARHGKSFQGFIFFSAIMQPEMLAQPAFHESGFDKPFLIIHGTADLRIPLKHAREAELMIRRTTSAKVIFTALEGDDHFLFFSRRPEITNAMADWCHRYDLLSLTPEPSPPGNGPSQKYPAE